MTERILKMPRLGETMDEGKVVGWLISPGDSFKRGDPILEIETDKTIAEFPALGDGRLEEILVSIGDMVEVGKPLARIDIGDGPDWTAEEGDETGPTPDATNDAGGWIEIDLAMPRLGETMEEGRIAKWLKAPGERFVRGEAILEIETDKTIAEFPALHDGRMVAILRGEGEMVTVGEPVARIEAPADQVAPAAERPAPAAQPETAVSAAPVHMAARREGRVRATPLARRLARRHGLDIAALPGTGRRGRIEKGDVLAAAGSGPGQSDVRFAALRRGRMAYSDSGAASGRPVLLLHGFSGDRTTWAAVAAGLKRAGRRVVAPDLPGHGLTDIDARDASDLAQDLPEFLDALGIAEVDVVAHSLGAVAALDLANAASGRVGSLSLIAPAGLGSQIDADFVRGMAQANAPGEVVHLLRRLSVNAVDLSEAALATLAKDLARGRLVALAGAVTGASGQKVDGLAAISRLSGTMPVRVLFGLEDRIIPWQHVLALPPTVAIHLLARSGHMPQWDQSKDVLEILTA
ncbi:acetoin dehydrogenase dihydrolipoyllysine-residue acetyltransferase subunit [Shinella zoogloeoides]|uniref:acetoin dehydrogenase dihydrolipoyllysine-residue acetyltransferase subunit n=1 Tax=Shinella zoogloeoides TaxID=352475 RepID=UPI00273E1BBB|nr:acetoin dehydrogenase dihydrolipoyllysine-residue acetyltransferase subunit [Shinella zoogloeoides]WLR93237.1 acetoin dehydrogenase dihydrolipoyllysine-residue acetyltransferase subunit [Shinella zoogloeoides]